MPRLENWEVINNKLYGEIYEDSRFPDGTQVTTSSIQKINETKTYAQTRNTLYSLGKPIVESGKDKVVRLATELVNELKGMGFSPFSGTTDLGLFMVWIDGEQIIIEKAGEFCIKGDK